MNKHIQFDEQAKRSKIKGKAQILNLNPWY